MPGQKNGKGAKARSPKKVQKKIQKHRTGRSQYKAITPGTGRSVSRAFGSSGAKPTASGAAHCWNALHPQHLALPRPVGPYTVLRMTTTFSTADPLVMIGSFIHNNSDFLRPTETFAPELASFGGGTREWSRVTALSCPRSHVNSPIAGYLTTGDANTSAKFNLYQHEGLAQLENNCQICPSAISVQVMNANAVQTTSGLCYAAVMPLEANYNNHGGGQTPSSLGQSMISFMKPRLLTLPKLALSGVYAQSHPLDMNDISQFLEIGSKTATGREINKQNLYFWGYPHQGSGSSDIANACVDISCQGWAPIVFYRPDAESVSKNHDPLTFQVTTEYRVRFDLSNPASASHRMHTPAPMPTYTNMIKDAVSALPGIVENVAAVAGSVGAAKLALAA